MALTETLKAYIKIVFKETLPILKVFFFFFNRQHIVTLAYYETRFQKLTEKVLVMLYSVSIEPVNFGDVP